jgi:hypothetical protein
MEVPLGMVFSVLSALIATSCNNRRTAGSAVFCWVHPKVKSFGPMGQASQIPCGGGSHTTIVAREVVRGERNPVPWGCKWATLFLGI